MTSIASTLGSRSPDQIPEFRPRQPIPPPVPLMTEQQWYSQNQTQWYQGQMPIQYDPYQMQHMQYDPSQMPMMYDTNQMAMQYEPMYDPNQMPLQYEPHQVFEQVPINRGAYTEWLNNGGFLMDPNYGSKLPVNSRNSPTKF